MPKLLQNLFIAGLLIISTPVNAEISTRIIGGQQTSIEKWKSMAALVISPTLSTSSLFNRQFCGGNLISDRWVISAAHCFFRVNASTGQMEQSTPDTLRVVLGIDDLNDTSKDELVVTNIITHPDYNPENAGSPNDIALLELAQTTNVPVMPLFLQSAPDGTSSVVIGWGATTFDPFTEQASTFPTILREVTVPIVSNDTCDSTAVYNGIIESSQLCAGLREGGKDSCSGDSGGPLMIEDNGVFKQAGIVSFGAGCALAEAYGVYTRIQSFESWIGGFVVDTGDATDANDKSGSSGLGASIAILLILVIINGVGMRISKRRGVV